MSGTSLDGIDIIYASYKYGKNWKFEIHHSETVKYPRHWKLTLGQLVNKSMHELRAIDKAYSEYLATVIANGIFKNIPAAKNDVVQVGQGDKILHQGLTVFGPFAQPDVAHLGEAANRQPQAGTDRMHASDEGGRDRTHTGSKDSQLPGCGFDLKLIRHSSSSSFNDLPTGRNLAGNRIGFQQP